MKKCNILQFLTDDILINIYCNFLGGNSVTSRKQYQLVRTQREILGAIGQLQTQYLDLKIN